MKMSLTPEERKVVNKLQNSLRLGGFILRRELCSFILHKLSEEEIYLNDSSTFDNCIKAVSESFERQNLGERSIEREHVEQAVNHFLHAGRDKTETVFNCIDAFSIPKLSFDVDRKQYVLSKIKSKFLSSPDTKAQLFIDRYTCILQRTQRAFKNRAIPLEDRLTLQTIDYLLTASEEILDKTFILGCLTQISEGKFALEDPTGLLELDLTHAKYHGGFFVENSFVLVNGTYDDKILHVASMILPAGEKYSFSRPSFGNLNYFGGSSVTLLRESARLRRYMDSYENNAMLFFSDVWFDHPLVFEKLELLFEGLHDMPPTAIVFMGNFMSKSQDSEQIELLRKSFKRLAELICNYQSFITNTHFVFVPGMKDLGTHHIVPRFALPQTVTQDFSRLVPKSHFTTNPCRIQYCTREITVFRADIFGKLLHGSLHKPPRDQIVENVTRTVLSQGHLCPFSLNILPVHWDFDYTLRLYPLPDAVVIGDKAHAYKGSYQGCSLVNPGPFCDGNFQFMNYIPKEDLWQQCEL